MAKKIANQNNIKLSKDILQKITDHYLSSRDFNGIVITDLGKGWERIKKILEDLVKEDKIVLNFGDRHPNIHILAFEPESKEEQIKKLVNLKFKKPIYEDFGPLKMQMNSVNCCAYPSRKHLKTKVSPEKYKDEPFKLLLALGEPCLSFRAFDLKVLENYRNDPRYFYKTDDIHGRIYAKSEAKLSDSDDIFLKTFGFAYDKKIEKRYVGAYLVYLAKLSPKHQQIWSLEMFDGETFLHPNYLMSTAGYFPETDSIWNAFCEEIRIINEMTTKIYNKQIFRQTYSRDNKPQKFSFLVRPTKEEYENFIHLLDKMISDNINKDFFKGRVDLKHSFEKNGILMERDKGTIQLLQEWLAIFIKFPNPKPMEEMLDIFKKIRKSRSKPAHHIKENVFDDKYFKMQRDLIRRAYKAIRTLRLILANHPLAKSIEVPDWLFEGKICTF